MMHVHLFMYAAEAASSTASPALRVYRMPSQAKLDLLAATGTLP